MRVAQTRQRARRCPRRFENWRLRMQRSKRKRKPVPRALHSKPKAMTPTGSALGLVELAGLSPGELLLVLWNQASRYSRKSSTASQSSSSSGATRANDYLPYQTAGGLLPLGVSSPPGAPTAPGPGPVAPSSPNPSYQGPILAPPPPLPGANPLNPSTPVLVR